MVRRSGCGTAMKNSGTIATSAVTTSIARMPCSGRSSNSSAPSGAENTLIPPHSIWFSPWMRARCSLGTISEVDAIIALLWKAPATERMNIRM